jgi:AcrR family transcriptional regulator
MEAVLDEVALHGYADFSVERVAAHAGVNKTTLYRRWGGRDALISAAIHTGTPDIEPVPDTGSLRGDLLAFARTHLAYFGTSRAAAITRAMNATTAPALVEARRELYKHREARLRSVFARAVERGELQSPDAIDIAVTLLFGSLQHHSVLMGRRVTAQWLEQTTDVVMRGIAGAHDS